LVFHLASLAKIHWEIEEKTPLFHPQIRKTTPVGCPKTVMVLVDQFLGVI
jgi:hypothetical protein